MMGWASAIIIVTSQEHEQLKSFQQNKSIQDFPSLEQFNDA
jgi:hypothetical protein